MSGTVNHSFKDNELDVLESGRRKTESVTNSDATSYSRKPWTAKSDAVNAYLSKHRRIFKTFVLVILNLLIIAYVVYAGIYWKDKFSGNHCDLQWCDGYGLLLILVELVYAGLFYFLIVKRYFGKYILRCCSPITNFTEYLQNTKYGTSIVRTILYVTVLIAIGIFLIADTTESRYRLISIIGIITIMGLGWIFSKHPGQINWTTVIWGLILQFVLGLITLRWPIGRSIFECISKKVATFLHFALAGANFVFSEYLVSKGIFAFAVLPVIFFFSFTVQILCYIGALQWIIVKLGWMLQSIMKTTLCESLIAVANPFIGMSESPLLIQPYINQLTSSELHAILSSGFSTVSGTVLAAYISFGANPGHLITASVMSAPTALCFSKLFYPETQKSLTKFENIKLEKSKDNSILDAATNGALAALPIVLGIVANIVAFVSFIEFFNAILSWFGGLVGYEALSLEIIFAKVFMPLSWVLGVPWEQCEEVATLIGLKTMVNELVAYQKMGEFKKQGKLFGRSEAIATFAICGFANPASIGIQIGVFSSLAPDKKEQVTGVILRSFVAGSAATFLTACIAGMLIDDISFPANVTASLSNITAATTLSDQLI